MLGTEKIGVGHKVLKVMNSPESVLLKEYFMGIYLLLPSQKKLYPKKNLIIKRESNFFSKIMNLLSARLFLLSKIISLNFPSEKFFLGRTTPLLLCWQQPQATLARSAMDKYIGNVKVLTWFLTHSSQNISWIVKNDCGFETLIGPGTFFFGDDKNMKNSQR